MPYADRPCGLDVNVVFGQTCARQQTKQRVEGRVLIRHDRNSLAFQVGRLADAGVRTHYELHESLAAEYCDHFHRDTVLPDDDWSVGHDPAYRHIARADLLGDIDAAAQDIHAAISRAGGRSP